MARYRKNPNAVRKRTNLTIDPEIWESMQEHCYSEGISVSELVNRLLKERLDEVDRKAFLEARRKAATKKK